MSKKNIAKYWAEKIAKSNGKTVFLPKTLSEAAKKLDALRNEITEKARNFQKEQAFFDKYAQDFWFSVRTELEKAGVEGAWDMNIGWDAEAKKDGMDVLNIYPASPGER